MTKTKKSVKTPKKVETKEVETPKTTPKTPEKVIKVEIEEKIIPDAPATFKVAPPVPEEPKEPKKPKKGDVVNPLVNPNDPSEKKSQDGYKEPSIMDIDSVYTKEQYEDIMEKYKKQNPEKYKAKRSEFAKKLKELK